jgi:hypothetical protein
LQCFIDRKEKSVASASDLGALRMLAIDLDIPPQHIPVCRGKENRALHDVIALLSWIAGLFARHHPKTKAILGSWKPDHDLEVRSLERLTATYC